MVIIHTDTISVPRRSGAGFVILNPVVVFNNAATVLPKIHHDADTMSDIDNALRSGKVIITHTDAASVPGWSGAGYIVLDQAVGDGAYRISGGMNGAFFHGVIFEILITLSLMAATILMFSAVKAGAGIAVVAAFG